MSPDQRNPWEILARAPACPAFVLTEERRASLLAFVEDCMQNHPLCSRPQWMPKRLVDLIPDGLSQTFRDVFNICQWLGVRYVWIDTFCIIQDDPHDLQDQASQMGSIVI